MWSLHTAMPMALGFNYNINPSKWCFGLRVSFPPRRKREFVRFHYSSFSSAQVQGYNQLVLVLFQDWKQQLFKGPFSYHSPAAIHLDLRSVDGEIGKCCTEFSRQRTAGLHASYVESGQPAHLHGKIGVWTTTRPLYQQLVVIFLVCPGPDPSFWK